MKSSHALAAALVALAPAAAMPSEYDVPLVRRAVGDRCTAPEGTGSCQHTAACAGISYPQALCPRDPNDVQVPPHRPIPSPGVHGLIRGGSAA